VNLFHGMLGHSLMKHRSYSLPDLRDMVTFSWSLV